ncbi:hypothetical protein PGB90_009588 [Kerria lacca]
MIFLLLSILLVINVPRVHNYSIPSIIDSDCSQDVTIFDTGSGYGIETSTDIEFESKSITYGGGGLLGYGESLSGYGGGIGAESIAEEIIESTYPSGGLLDTVQDLENMKLNLMRNSMSYMGNGMGNLFNLPYGLNGLSDFSYMQSLYENSIPSFNSEIPGMFPYGSSNMNYPLNFPSSLYSNNLEGFGSLINGMYPENLPYGPDSIPFTPGTTPCSDNIPYIPNIPGMPPFPYIPGMPPFPHIPGMPPFPYIPGMPLFPHIPGMPPFPYIPGMPPFPHIPGMPPFPYIPGMPPFPHIPGMPPFPYIPGMPPFPHIPGMPPFPYIPGMPPFPYIPGMPPFPHIPGMPPFPYIPGMPPFPYTPGKPNFPYIPNMPYPGYDEYIKIITAFLNGNCYIPQPDRDWMTNQLQILSPSQLEILYEMFEILQSETIGDLFPSYGLGPNDLNEIYAIVSQLLSEMYGPNGQVQYNSMMLPQYYIRIMEIIARFGGNCPICRILTHCMYYDNELLPFVLRLIEIIIQRANYCPMPL